MEAQIIAFSHNHDHRLHPLESQLLINAACVSMNADEIAVSAI